MSDQTKPLLVSIIGPTAVGKTSLAIRIAKELKTEIISADSRQFFKELTIGTAKPSKEELNEVQHHFIDSHSINEMYTSGQFGRDVEKVLNDLFQKYPVVVAVGGSTLYLKAIWEGFDEMPSIKDGIREALNLVLKSENGLAKLQKELEQNDPEYYKTVDKSNGQRIVRALEVTRSTGKPFSSFRHQVKRVLPYRNLKIGLDMDREVLFDRINQRMDQMIVDSLFEEAASLHSYREHNALQTVGYSEIFDYLEGKYDKAEAIRLLKRNSRRYAKRQLTWFKKYDDIHWFHPDDEKEITQLLFSHLK